MPIAAHADSWPAPAAHGPEHIAHKSSGLVLLGDLLAVLITLTLVTLAASWVNLGERSLLIAMGIATVKASLVALYFMHLRYDNPFNALIFVTALTFLGIFLSLTLLDALQYAPNYRVEMNRPINFPMQNSG